MNSARPDCYDFTMFGIELPGDFARGQRRFMPDLMILFEEVPHGDGLVGWSPYRRSGRFSDVETAHGRL